MPFVMGALAACTGVLLAAMESPRLHDRARLQRFSVALLAATAAAIAISAAIAIHQ